MLAITRFSVKILNTAFFILIEGGVAATGYMTDANGVATQYITEDGTPILIDVSTGEGILNPEEQQQQSIMVPAESVMTLEEMQQQGITIASENAHSIIATTSGDGDVIQTSLPQTTGTVVQHEASDGSMQPVYLAYQSY